MNSNRVTLDHIQTLIASSDIQSHVFWDKEVVLSMRLPNVFTVLGRGACVDPANFDFAIGYRVALEDIENKLWQLEGYLLQDRLHRQGIL